MKNWKGWKLENWPIPCVDYIMIISAALKTHPSFHTIQWRVDKHDSAVKGRQTWQHSEGSTNMTAQWRVNKHDSTVKGQQTWQHSEGLTNMTAQWRADKHDSTVKGRQTWQHSEGPTNITAQWRADKHDSTVKGRQTYMLISRLDISNNWTSANQVCFKKI